jgi:hypothetical protein
MYQATPIFSRSDDVDLTFIVGEFRDVDGFGAHRPMIGFNLLGYRFLFDCWSDLVER